MEGANLSEANLVEAQLKGTDLEEACLKQAALPHAEALGLADLEDTNLYGAKLPDGDSLNSGTGATLQRRISNLHHGGLRDTPDTNDATLKRAMETDIEGLAACQ